MNARYYDAELGRFISADTQIPDLTNPQALNRYLFAYGNPVSNIDPTGHAPVVVAVVAAAAAAGTEVAVVAWVGAAFVAVGYVTDNPLLMTIGSICLGFAGGYLSPLVGGVAGGVLGATVAALTSPLSPLDSKLKQALGLMYMAANVVAGQMQASKALETESAAANKAVEGTSFKEYKWENPEAAKMALHRTAEASGRTIDQVITSLKDSGQLTAGVDCQFGMIGPTGGGMFTTVLDKALGWIPSVRLHGIVHDAYGQAFESYKVGPGYTYAGAIPLLESIGNKYSGQLTGVWRNSFMAAR